MRCEYCGTENVDSVKFCKECGASLVPLAKKHEIAEAEVSAFPLLSRFFAVLWSKKGPILMAVFIVLMMAMVYAPWALFKFQLLGFSLVSRRYNGWEIYIPRIFLYVSIIPLVISLLMIAGISTRRQVIETHICAFLGGVMFTVWTSIFALSNILKSLIRNVKVLEISVGAGQVTTIFLFLGFMLGIIITSYDRGRELSISGEGG